MTSMEEQEALYQDAVVQAKIEQGALKRKLTDDGYDADALADLEQWREDRSNWEGIAPEDEEDAPPVKRQYKEKDEEQTHKEDKLVEFFKDRVKDFKLFLQRRLPPDNEQAQEYFDKFFKTTDQEFAIELKTKLNSLSWIGGIDMLFTLMCNKTGMRSTDFVDRSVDISSWPEKKKQEQLQFEILDYHSQLKELLKLAKELPESFFE